MRQMKDSGIEWIGEIPENWTVCKLKNVASIITGNTPSKTNGDSYYTDEGLMWVKPDNLKGTTSITETNEYLSSEGAEMARVVPPNTPLVCCIGSIGKIGVADQAVAFNQQINAVNYNKNIDRRYGLYYLVSQEEQHKMRANGNVLLILNSEQQGLIPFLMPPLEAQTSIASYLDAKCAEIDALIAAKEKTNALLRERRQSIIYEAVTKGLNPDVPMKDSGIEWIGQIPETHQLVRLKYLCKIFGRIGFRGYTQADLVPEGEGPITLSPSNISENGMDYSKCTYLTWDKYYESPEIQIENNDILLVKTGSSYGKSTIVENLPMEATINPQFVVMKNIKCHPKFLHYIMQTQIIKYQVEQVVVGGTIPTIAQEKINNFHIVLPSEDEICAIVDYLDGKCAEFDTLISANEVTIKKLKEYRESIIYEAVTGKIEI